MSVSAPIDSILGILVQQAATELRLGTDRAPKMFQRATQKRLAIPETSDDTLRHLLGAIFSNERERTMRESGRLELTYDAAALGTFHVTLTARAQELGFDVVFVRASAPRAPAPAPGPALAPAAGPALAPAPGLAPAPALAAPYSFDAVESVSPALASLLARAAASRASDVHLSSGEPPAVRVDGKLRALDDEPPADLDQLLGPQLMPLVRERLAEGRSADAAIDVVGVGRVRINVYRASQGTAAAIRLLAHDAPSLASLHLPVPIDDLVDLPHGLVIVCGPTGSGKSTTLAALAQEALRRRSALVITLEDPIEYVLSSQAGLVRQRQVGRDVKDFAHGLRDALREDPDILLIGEMRDPETISLALTAAETGHLVLTSLHSRSASSAIERIVDSYPPARQQQIRVQLADALRAVVAQRLLPRARGAGRVAALEILRGTHNVASVIRDGKTAQLPTAIQSGRKEGMLPLERCLADLVRASQITVESARAVANEASSLQMYLKE